MSSLKNAILTRFDGGYRTDTNAGSISSNGRREAFLSLGSVRSSPNTDRVVSEYLGTLLGGVTTVTAQVQPTTVANTPYVGQWTPGASVTVPRPSASGVGEVMQVRAMTVTEDDDGVLSFTPELVRQAATRQTLVDTNLKRLGAGTLSGRSQSATLATDIDPDARAGKCGTQETNFTKDVLEAAESPKYVPTDYFVIQSLFVTLKTSGSTATTFQVKINGVAQTFRMIGYSSSSTLTIPANVGATFGIASSYQLVQPTDTISVEIVSAGTNAAGFLCRMTLAEW